MECTWCEDCANVEAVSRRRPYMSQWLCTRYPNTSAAHGFVSRLHPVEEPLHRCHRVNPDGQCAKFERAVSNVARRTPEP